jgi:hypothetical protein
VSHPGVSRQGANLLKTELEQLGAVAVLVRSPQSDLVDWLEEPEPGRYAVELVGVNGIRDEILGDMDVLESRSRLAEILNRLSAFRAEPELAHVTLDRATHIGPEIVAEAVSDAYAIKLKQLLEQAGGKVHIREKIIANQNLRRRAIPESVRHEVWRRDEGRCVDCESREDLEFDHIIPLSKGGSNTARNLELRCESCNKRKSARI